MRSSNYFEQILELLTPHYRVPLVNDPATEDEVQGLEAHIGYRLPDELRAIYLLHNGGFPTDSAEETSWLMIYDFISLEEIASTYDLWVETIIEFEAFPDPAAPEFFSCPPNTVKPVYFDRGWIPFAKDYGGNYLAIDFSPDTQGTVGQVINFGRDNDEHFQFSKDFTGFLKFTFEMYQAGRFHPELVTKNQSDDVIQFQRQKFGLV